MVVFKITKNNQFPIVKKYLIFCKNISDCCAINIGYINASKEHSTNNKIQLYIITDMENYNRIYNILLDVYRNNIRKKSSGISIKSNNIEFLCQKRHFKKINSMFKTVYRKFYYYFMK